MAAIRPLSPGSSSTANDRGGLFVRNLARLRGALQGEPIPGGDTLYPQQPELVERIWQATFSVTGGARAGLAGDGLMLSRTQPRPAENPNATLAELQDPIIDAYLAALPPDRAPRIVGSRSVFVAESRSEALRLADIGLRTQFGASSTRVTAARRHAG